MTDVEDRAARAVAHPNPRVRPGAVVLVLAIAGITAALMQTLVVPLIPVLPRILGTSSSNASWVITATLLTGAVATPVSGRLGDLLGKRRIMLICAVVLIVGSAVCAMADNVVLMILGRALQGVGMGIIPLGISAMRDLLPAEKLGTSIALMSASMGVGGALGLPVAAAVAEHSNWRVLFWGSTGLAVVVALLILTLIPGAPGLARGRFDVVGAVGLGAGLVCLLLGVSKGADWGWGSGATLGCLIAAVVLLLAWGFFELRTRDPLVDLRVTARPVVLLTNAASIVVGFAMYAQSLILPQLLELPTATGYGLGQSMVQMGLWMLPGGLMMMLVSPIGGRISKASSPKVTLALGAAVVAVGYGAAVLLMGSTWGLMIAVMIANSGVGLAYGAMPALIMGSVPLSETASANSFNTLMRSLGTSISAAVVGVVLTQMSTTVRGYTLPTENGFKTGLLIGAGVALVAMVIASVIPARGSRRAEQQIDHATAVRASIEAVPVAADRPFLVVVDVIETAAAVVDRAADIAEESAARLQVVQVHESVLDDEDTAADGDGDGDGDHGDHGDAAAKAALRGHLDRLANRGVAADGMVLHNPGDPTTAGRVLADYAEQVDARGIAFGVANHGPYVTQTDGGLSAALTRESTRQILLVPVGGDAGPLIPTNGRSAGRAGVLRG